jgi:hypothetical protein
MSSVQILKNIIIIIIIGTNDLILEGYLKFSNFGEDFASL